MAQGSRRLLAALTALALVMALAPTAALAAPTDRAAKKRVARRTAAKPGSLRVQAIDGPVATVTKDARDGADGDDVPAGATDLTGYVSYGDDGSAPPNGFGRGTRDIAAVIATATNETAPGAGDFDADEDWYRIDVSAWDVMSGIPFTVEAKTNDPYVDPMIDVYGPTSAATLTPTPAHLLVQGPADEYPGWGTLDSGNDAFFAGSDNGAWWDFAGGYSAGVTFVPPQAGTYLIRVRPWFDGAPALEDPAGIVGYNTLNGAGPYSLRVKAGVFTRLAGTGRVQTAIEMSRERYADGELPLLGGAVVLANGWNYPDALAGSTLAGAAWGPLLLTHQGYLDAEVKAEIERLGADRVFILGSDAAVAPAVASALVGVNGMVADDIVRVAGAGRVQTAVEIAREANMELGTAPIAFVANGWGFPDALAASPMAAWNVAPLLLTHKDFLDGDTAEAIDELGVTDVVILGSPNAVGTGVESALVAKLGTGHVKRIGGGDRYETAQKFATWATGDYGANEFVGADATLEENKLWPLEWDKFGVAAGFNYPDALGGGAFAGNVGRPLLLTPAGAGVSPRILNIHGTTMPGTSYLSFDEHADNYVGHVQRSYLFGGPTVVDGGVWQTLDTFSTMPELP